jgi:hypothetical protein
VKKPKLLLAALVLVVAGASAAGSRVPGADRYAPGKVVLLNAASGGF